MGFKMKYGKGGFPYKTPLNRHMQGHDPLTENIKDTRDLSDEDYYELKKMHDDAPKHSKNIGPAESPEMIEEKKRIAREEIVGPSGTVFDADEADWEKDRLEKLAHQEAKKYIK